MRVQPATGFMPFSYENGMNASEDAFSRLNGQALKSKSVAIPLWNFFRRVYGLD